MKHTYKNIFAAALLGITTGFAAAANADCFVDYKAKRMSGSLELHYGVMQLNDNVCANLRNRDNVVKNRLAKDNWVLLNILSTFDADGALSKQENAGEFYLRY